MIKILMIPNARDTKSSESGIFTIVRKWFKYLPSYGIELVDKGVDDFDILAVHAGMGSKYPADVKVVSHLHGIYFTSDYAATNWEWAANENVIASARRADAITVPSYWVAETIQRDMRVDPYVVPHGIDWQEWQHDYPHEGYILAYAKNRVMDVCNPAFISELARRYPDKLFICTYAPKDAPANVRVTGLLPHEKMREVIQRAALVISPVKETFGVLTLESLASGTPVLGYDYGGNKDLIQHGVDGYLAQVGNIDDLSQGLDYCLQHREVLSKNGKELSKLFTWDIACQQLAEIYASVMQPTNNKISVVIPSYNYASKIEGAILSVLTQTVLPQEIIVVDDGSPDNGETQRVVTTLAEKNHIVDIRYHRQDNAGVAVARNAGIQMAKGEYIVCLDADDRIDFEFLRACKTDLDADPTLGIAYTGLLAVEPDGRQSVSQWPPDYNFDDMVYPGGINQIPTCCMFRKKMWQRLGGFRSRYCLSGAGSEDAEFWLRAGLYGFPGKKVTDAPLFIYAYKSGQVSGNKDYHEVDWRGLHPSTRDHQHPFPCVATPDNRRPSHPVRQYDEPLISVIIPVGNGHKQHVFNALDSLEAQTLRKWEAILVDDAPDDEQWTFDGVQDVIKAYPYARIFKTGGSKGAGYARNRGVEQARAALITFLDADDNFLIPDALEKMLSAWNQTGMAVYTDYISKAVISQEEADRLQNNRRLVSYNPKDGMAMHLSYAGEYECDRAVIQPANPLYIWNLITTLIPKAWHDEIGGFDERMPSWEDWEYWLRMARAGKCFVRLAEPMVVYRFYTGGRRETGIQMPKELLSYISDKLKGVDIMPCRSCGGKGKVLSVKVVPKAVPQPQNMESQMTDADMILVTYENPNRGQHKVVGAVTKIHYGYRSGGGVEKFYVHRSDIEAQPQFYKPFTPPQVIVEQPAPVAPPSPEPVIMSIPDFVETKPASESLGPGQSKFKPVDFQKFPGVTDKIAEAMKGLGIISWDDIIRIGKDGLLTIEGIGEKRAEVILHAAKKNTGDE